jgi:hypothetical protein
MNASTNPYSSVGVVEACGEGYSAGDSDLDRLSKLRGFFRRLDEWTQSTGRLVSSCSTATSRSLMNRYPGSSTTPQQPN